MWMSFLEPLFSSRDKYDSGCRWPASRSLIVLSSINENGSQPPNDPDKVRGRDADSHLEHVFPMVKS